MASLAVFRTMMNPLVFSNAAAEQIYNNQGIGSLEEVAFLSREGNFNFMKTVRIGGYEIEDPANLGNMIWDPGFLVSNLAE